MTSLRKFTIRLAVYGIALVYLALDLFVFHGPLAKRIERVGTGPDDGNVVARVFNHHITLDQLDRAVRERLWLEGRNAGELSADELKLIRYVALDAARAEADTVATTHALAWLAQQEGDDGIVREIDHDYPDADLSSGFLAELDRRLG